MPLEARFSSSAQNLRGPRLHGSRSPLSTLWSPEGAKQYGVFCIKSTIDYAEDLLLISRSLSMIIPFHLWDPPFDGELSRKEDELKYFPLRILARRQFGLNMMRQLTLLRRASLNPRISMSSMPPSLLPRAHRQFEARH